MESSSVVLARRAKVCGLLGGRPFVLAAGEAPPRNYAANAYAFRASSHFLYLAGVSVEGSYLLVHGDGEASLFVPAWDAAWALWHGEPPALEALAAATGAAVRPLAELPAALAGLGALTLPPPGLAACQALSRLLERPVEPGVLGGGDALLADAMIQARLRHDEAALAGIREAVSVTAAAFAAGLAATRPGALESSVRAAMEAPLTARGLTTAYAPIISVRGEVLHNNAYGNRMAAGDLLLVDFGAESAGGWASDVTRTWPVSGRLTGVQRAWHGLVEAALEAGIAAAGPGVRYRDVHVAAARVLAEGLVELGVLRGDAGAIVEEGAHALLFPHGIGHLLGLDVHDMEDLGDRAGYAPGWSRDARFGARWLRLDRVLEPGMVVTVEPGLYIVPAILREPSLAGWVREHLDLEALARCSEVRGIRLEDDILITATGRENLTRHIPRSASELEAALDGVGVTK